MSRSINTICVIGAGTMGSGIALVAAQSGYNTLLFDINKDILDKAVHSVQKNLQYLVDNKKISAEEKENVIRRIRFITDTNDCIADIIIEAIIEKSNAKAAVFNLLAELNHSDVIFATNTSSLSVSAIQAMVAHPERVAGMHFFNPAQVMKLVEVVKGDQTADQVVQTIYELCITMNKTPVMCKDAPGFIVNRVARHYYLEAMKLVEKGVIGVENVDVIMESLGFKLGPFRLMDLIGMDINLAVSQSIYEAFNKEERFKPSPLQIDKVANGELGKKTGKGFYEYY